jgi:hypothetical protein
VGSAAATAAGSGLLPCSGEANAVAVRLSGWAVLVAVGRGLAENFGLATPTPISVGTRPTTISTNNTDAESRPTVGAQRQATKSASSLVRTFIHHSARTPGF